MKILTVTAAISLLIAGPVWAEDFSVPIKLPAGSVILLTVEKTLTKTEGGQSQSQGGVFRYRQEISPLKDGYRVRQTLTGLEMPGVSPAELQQAKTLTEASVNVTYEAGGDLAPARVVGWPAQVDKMINAMTAAGAFPDAATATAMRKMYSSWSAEDGAAQFKEQNLIAAVQDAALDLKKPLSGSGDVQSPLGGPPIRQNYSAELTAVTKAAGTATIKTSESLDSASLTANLKAAVPRMIAQLAPTAPRPTEAELAALKFERTTECTYDMDLKTGLTRKADCTKTETGIDGGLRRTSKVERFVMTQVLAPK